jgi:hypothetical protein
MGISSISQIQLRSFKHFVHASSTTLWLVPESTGKTFTLNQLTRSILGL